MVPGPRSDHADTLWRLARLALDGGALDDLLDAVACAAAEELDAPLAGIFRYDDDLPGQVLRAGYGWGDDATEAAPVGELGQGLLGRLAKADGALAWGESDGMRQRLCPFARDAGARAALGVALRVEADGANGPAPRRPDPAGALVVLDRRPRAWSPADRRFLQDAASLLARAIRLDDDATAARQVRRYARTVAECAHDLVDPACAGATEAAAATLRHALDMLDAPEGGVLVGGPAGEGGGSTPRVLAGTPGLCEGLGISREIPPAGTTLSPLAGQAQLLLHTHTTGCPFHTSDVQRHPSAAGKAPLVLGAGEPAVQLVAAPITLDGAVMGQLTVARPGPGPRDFCPSDGRALGTLAAQLAMALGRLAQRDARMALREETRPQRRTELITRFAAGLVHHLARPVRRAYTRAQAALASPPDASLSRATLEDVAADLGRVEPLLDELSTMAGASKRAPELLDVVASLAALKPALQEAVGASRRLEVSLPTAVRPIPLDPQGLRRAVLELVRNAARATGPGDVIEVGLALDELSDGAAPSLPALGAGSKPATLHLWVRDGGAGMVQATALRAVEPFFTTAGWHERPGLGLAVVRAFADAAGGRLELDSTPARGTTVHLYLPAPALVSAVPPPCCTVLVLEPDPAIGRLARRLLEDAGHRVLSAREPASAAEVVLRDGGPISALVTEAIFPSGTARDLLDALRELGLVVPPVLFMSNFPRAAVARVLGPEAAASCLAKPFAPAELLERVETICADAPAGTAP